MDLGPCNKIHEAALKADFELASKRRDYGYDVDVSRVHVKAKAEVLEVRLVILDIVWPILLCADNFVPQCFAN